MARKQQQRNGKPTNVRILETATRLFAEKGYHGTSVDEIVERAGVNKRMVYHYFGSKLELYQRVIANAYEELTRFEAGRLESVDDLDAVIARLVETGFAFSKAHPEFSRLMLWENLNKGRGIKSANSHLSKGTVLKKLEASIRASAASGKYREDLDARFLFLLILGLTHIFVSNRYTLSQGLDLDLASPKVLERGMRNAIACLRAGIRAE